MGRVYDIPLIGGQNTIDRGFDIPWVGSKYHRPGTRYTVGGRFDISWVRGSIYHE